MLFTSHEKSLGMGPRLSPGKRVIDKGSKQRALGQTIFPHLLANFVEVTSTPILLNLALVLRCSLQNPSLPGVRRRRVART